MAKSFQSKSYKRKCPYMINDSSGHLLMSVLIIQWIGRKVMKRLFEVFWGFLTLTVCFESIFWWNALTSEKMFCEHYQSYGGNIWFAGGNICVNLKETYYAFWGFLCPLLCYILHDLVHVKGLQSNRAQCHTNCNVKPWSLYSSLHKISALIDVK